MTDTGIQLRVCAGGACLSSGGDSVAEAFRRELKAHRLGKKVSMTCTGCMGLCQAGPLVIVNPEGILYQKVTPQDVPEIVASHLLKGAPVERLFFRDPLTGNVVPKAENLNFFRHQKKITLRNCGIIDPVSLDSCLAAGGYEALRWVLTKHTPAKVIEEIKTSGLRGRGGAGFPTGLKWAAVAAQAATPKYVVCNADEGDPGAFMDRSVLEGDPHSVIEAMAICGYAVGAAQGYVYVRAEYPLAIERLTLAIRQARERGLLGNGICGTEFSFDLDIRMGAGAFVCGEETALMHSIEGRRGEPRPKPPFPAQSGLFGKPTVLNNVETFAAVPWIIRQGGAAYAAIGTEKSKGTKVFALAGDVHNTGLVEVPMGIPLGTIIHDIGGGIPHEKKFKAVQIGGPSGGCIPAAHLNTPITYESLPQLGAIMGSGGLIVMDEDTCMVDLARYFLEFIVDESCGKCTPCRVGTRIMLELVNRICRGEGTLADLEQLETLAQGIRQTSLCGLGQTAPNPVLSTLRYFRDEYLEHIHDKFCRAGVCRRLVYAPCVNACPANVNVPSYLALVKEGRFADALRVHLRNNPFPAVCGRVCPQWCTKKCRRDDLEGPLAVRAVKRYIGDLQADYGALYPEKAPANGLRVAVIGAGPAGLSCAYFLTLLGYEVSVFEKQPEAGGLMRYAIPDYRLPRNVLAKEIAGLVRLGVRIRTGVTVGKDVTMDQLRKDGFGAVFVSVGAGREILPAIPGVDLPGVEAGTAFLERAAKGEKMRVGREVLVVGGGDAAIDCSREAKRFGAASVTVLYRRTRKEMPTSPIEIREAEVEGVNVEFLVTVTAIRRSSGGRLVATLQKMQLGAFDASGRRRPEPLPGSETEREADTILLAIGHEPDLAEVLDGSPAIVTAAENAKAAAGGKGKNLLVFDGKTGGTGVPGVFGGGDDVYGPATVIEAIGAGQRAAKSIDQSLRPGPREYVWEKLEQPDVPVTAEQELAEVQPVEYPLLSVEERLVSVEVEKTIDPAAAKREAGRCLRCDLNRCSCGG